MSTRITQSVTNRTYLSNLTKATNNKNRQMEKIQTGRDFERVSDHVSAGLNAISIRSKLYKNEQMTENIATAYEQLSNAENNLTSINDILITVQGEVMKALNGTNPEGSDVIFDSIFENSKESIADLANGKFNDKYILGGSNIEKQPFSFDDDGMLLYQGVRMDSVVSDSGQFKYDVGGTLTRVPYSEDTFIDIGLDIKVENGKIDPQTAYKVSVSGLSTLGYGTTDLKYTDSDGSIKTYSGISNNIVDIITEMQKAYKDGDMDKLDALRGHMNKRMDQMMSEVAIIGTRCQFLDATTQRLENDNISLHKMQQDTEGIDDATEIMYYQQYDYAMNLTLQFGSSVIPKSLMDYIV